MIDIHRLTQMTNRTKIVKLYLTAREHETLRNKSKELGLNNQDFLRKVINEDFCFLDSNLKNLLKQLTLD